MLKSSQSTTWIISYRSSSEMSLSETRYFASQPNFVSSTNVDSSSVTATISYLGFQVCLGFVSSFRKRLLIWGICLKKSWRSLIWVGSVVNEKVFQRLVVSMNVKDEDTLERILEWMDLASLVL